METLHSWPEAGNQSSASNLIQFLCFNSSMIPSRGSQSASSIDQSTMMVCVDCFQTKGDSQKTLCQNPNCCFYLQSFRTQTRKSIVPTRRHASISELSYDPCWPSFNSSVEPPTTSNATIGSSDAIWHAWANPYPVSSQSSSGPGLNYGSRTKQRSQSTCFDSGPTNVKTNGFRSRLMSLPVPELYEPVEATDLVEDAFISGSLVKDEFKVCACGSH